MAVVEVTMTDPSLYDEGPATGVHTWLAQVHLGACECLS